MQVTISPGNNAYVMQCDQALIGEINQRLISKLEGHKGDIALLEKAINIVVCRNLYFCPETAANQDGRNYVRLKYFLGRVLVDSFIDENLWDKIKRIGFGVYQKNPAHRNNESMSPYVSQMLIDLTALSRRLESKSWRGCPEELIDELCYRIYSSASYVKNDSLVYPSGFSRPLTWKELIAWKLFKYEPKEFFANHYNRLRSFP